MSGKRSRRPIELPSPGESSGCADLGFRLLCGFVELCVIMTGLIIVGTLLV